MCDTLVAVKDATKTGRTLFAKNSDRDPNETHNILHLPRMKHESSTVKCTYIRVPQVQETYEVLLLKPFWLWGAEMGSNEFGVTIGNEAVWTKVPLAKEALTGMDLVRLALERSRTAREALEVITQLLETYGQGGNAGYEHKLSYHNSFIVADPREAWVLETAGQFWIAKKVEDIATISNILTIGSDYDLIHPDLIPFAVKHGYSSSADTFHFARDFSKKFLPWIARGKERQRCTFSKLKQQQGNITVRTLMEILRLHRSSQDFSPRTGSMASPCMHASSFLTPSQTVGSLVSDLREPIQVHWVTGTAAPCTSLFKPLILGADRYDFPQGDQYYSEDSLWWQHERLHRLILLNYHSFIQLYKSDRDQLENQWIAHVDHLLSSLSENAGVSQLRQALYEFSRQWWNEAREREETWLNLIQQEARQAGIPLSLRSWRYRRFWKKWNKKARMPPLF